MFLVSPPLGVVIGYVITAILIANFNWKWAFYMQAALMLPCIICFLMTPTKYFDIEAAVEKK